MEFFLRLALEQLVVCRLLLADTQPSAGVCGQAGLLVFLTAHLWLHGGEWKMLLELHRPEAVSLGKDRDPGGGPRQRAGVCCLPPVAHLTI